MNILKRLTLLAGIVGMCAACSGSSEEVTPATSTTHTMQITGVLPDLNPETAAERATGQSVIRLQWMAGDEVSVINLTTGKALGGTLKADATGTTARFSGTVTGTLTSGDQLALLYPAQGYTAEQPFSAAKLDFSTQPGTEQAPLCVYGTVDYKGKPLTNVQTKFNYLMAYVRLNLANLTANKPLQQVVVTNVAAKMKIMLSCGEFVVSPEMGNLTIRSTLAVNASGNQTIFFSVPATAAQTERKIRVRQEDTWYEADWTTVELKSAGLYNSVVSSFAAATEDPQNPDPVEGELRANGDSAHTYDLIKACGYGMDNYDTVGDHAGNPFQHIKQSWSEELNSYVFDFYIHANSSLHDIDDKHPDRQRNEIKTDATSPASMVGQQGDRMTFRWKFRLPEGMQATEKFCHVHQIKGIGSGTNVAYPNLTYTVRKMSNGKEQFQIIYVEDTGTTQTNYYLARLELSDFLGRWVEVEESITFGESGTFQTRIRRIDDQKILADIARTSVVPGTSPAVPINMWRPDAPGMRPKWGIYRQFEYSDNGTTISLLPMLRDEIVQFADFAIVKE